MSFHVILLDIIFIVIFPTLVSSIFLFLIHGFFILTERAFCQRLLRRFCPNSNFIVQEHSEYSQNGVDTGLAIEAGCEGLTTEERRQIFALVLKEQPHEANSKITDPGKDGASGQSSVLTINSTMDSSQDSFHEVCDSRSDAGLDSDEDSFDKEDTDASKERPEVPIEVDQNTSNPQENDLEAFIAYDNNDDDDDEDEGCAICLADYTSDDSILCAKHCTHKFHKECLLLWLEKKDVCPFCREPMLTAEEMKWAQQQLLSTTSSDGAQTSSGRWRNLFSMRQTIQKLPGLRNIVSRTVDRSHAPSSSPDTSGNVLVQESDNADEVEIILLRTRTAAEV